MTKGCRWPASGRPGLTRLPLGPAALEPGALPAGYNSLPRRSAAADWQGQREASGQEQGGPA
ncbi:hypothetical protein [Hymenobacter sp. GOD-10R]|uniref:hypothetical protein n=1 Tax=Hymenobacter sp. GOD-10R TaxID=3093922 RepID=UPI002D791A0A|nr:hypothetical protein [Hymenobacter sp. GOD-10R]WRQ31863.1 hypothetical protein SD425_29405 [Hymenobacter sp. GOD-10R]